MMGGKAVLVVLDGWGIGAGDSTDAIASADAPFIKGLLRTAPSATLLTHGAHVGLPDGQMGNSEVGHLNIGAGRVVHQELVRIGRAIDDGSLAASPVLRDALANARRAGHKLHLIGLLSEGGVHSHRAHAEALARIAAQQGVPEVFVHAFTDGRDADPRSGKASMTTFLANTAGLGVRIASVIGRYYAMDRDKRWERIKAAYDLLVHGRGTPVHHPLDAFDRSYAEGTTDEFIRAHVVVGADGRPVATIAPGETVICFNFRTDRCREITEVLTQQALPAHGMAPLPLHYVTMTEYDGSYTGVEVLFGKDELRMTLGEVVAVAGREQARIAETEKYPHVTYFFNGGREEPFPGERRVLVPSPKVATYDLQPEMSAPGVADAAVRVLEEGKVALMVVNFANPDMVGHTGVFDAIRRSVEATDRCAQRVVEAARRAGYAVMIIADHGNADQARNADGSPNTAHSMNPVPMIVLADGVRALRSGVLADVAPTLLELMGMEKPAEMTGSSLIVG